jgi:hypothetical protein
MGTIQIDGSTPKLTIGNATAEDATILFDGNAQDFYIALDDSADDLLIGLGSTVGSTPAISIDENLAVKTYGDITMTGTTPVLTIGDAGAEDTAIVFDGNAQDFYIALDDSADDLVIGLGSTVGTTPAISINEDRDVTISDGAIDFDVASHDGTNGLKLGGTLVTTTAAELNLLDGDTSVGSSITIADADGFVVNDGGTMKTIPASDISTYAGGGISAASQWRLTTSFSGGAAPIASNLEEVDTDGYGSLGSSMTESSGIFTFPSTGYWLIEFRGEFYYDGDSRYVYVTIDTTTDDSSYANAAYSVGGIAQSESSHTHANAKASFIFDVTSTSTHKVRFTVNFSDASVNVYGNTDMNITSMTFIRLGDT